MARKPYPVRKSSKSGKSGGRLGPAAVGGTSGVPENAYNLNSTGVFLPFGAGSQHNWPGGLANTRKKQTNQGSSTQPIAIESGITKIWYYPGQNDYVLDSEEQISELVRNPRIFRAQVAGTQVNWDIVYRASRRGNMTFTATGGANNRRLKMDGIGEVLYVRASVVAAVGDPFNVGIDATGDQTAVKYFVFEDSASDIAPATVVTVSDLTAALFYNATNTSPDFDSGTIGNFTKVDSTTVVTVSGTGLLKVDRGQKNFATVFQYKKSTLLAGNPGGGPGGSIVNAGFQLNF